MIWPDMTWMYIIGYTLGNFAFKRGALLQDQAQTLVVYMMFSLSFDFMKSEYFQIIPTYKESMWMAVVIISFVVNLGLFVYMIYTIVRDKKKPLKDELYSHTNAYMKNIGVNNLR